MFFTIGHSNRSWEEFVELLERNGVEAVADVRRFPGSRKWPQYRKEAMERRLAESGISYVHIGGLGGRRRPDGSDRNAGWENEAFRGYADHTATEEFAEGMRALLALEGRVAIMCSEAVPWRCHRRIISDLLTARGFTVHEIIGAGEPKPHRLTAFARVDDGEVSYPEADSVSGSEKRDGAEGTDA